MKNNNERVEMVNSNIKYRWDFIGLSTDVKPTPEESNKVVNGSTYYESDTSKLYVFYKDNWYERKPLGGGGGGVDTPATDNDYGLVKTNSEQNVTLDDNGQLIIGGRLGQTTDGGLYYPTDAEPTSVSSSAMMITDGAKGLETGSRTFSILAGANLTCKSAAAGTTQYRLANTMVNRFACYAGKGGHLAIDAASAKNGTSKITDISFANGNPISVYFGGTESDNDIIITVDKTVNPDAPTTKLRIYGKTGGGNDQIIIGQGTGSGGSKAIALGQSCYTGENQNLALGFNVIVNATNSVGLGHTHIVNKRFCFCAGQAHDFTNGINGSAAVGIASQISSDTLFAVGNGKYNSSGSTTRSNAFEVLSDGGIVLKSPNNTRYKITVDDAGNLTTSPLT